MNIISFFVIIAIYITFILTFIITNITEKYIIPRLGKYEISESEEEKYVTKKEIKALEKELKTVQKEADKLTARKKSLENKIDGLKNWLLYALNGEKLKTPRCNVYQTHSQKVVIDDEKALIDMFMSSPSGEKFLRMKDPEIDKTALKDSMKQGYEYKFAHLEETESVVIK